MAEIVLAFSTAALAIFSLALVVVTCFYVNLLSTPLRILFKFYLFQVDFGVIKIQRSNKFVLELSQRC